MGGDIMNMSSMSHWAETRDRMVELSSIKDEYDAFNKFLDDFLTHLPRGCNVVWILGNHEDWCRQYQLANPKVAKYLGIEENLHLKERGITLIEFNKVYSLGKMNFTHGYYTNDHHTKKMCQNYRKSIFYSHTHDIQRYTHISPIDSKDYHTAQSVGTLSKMNPVYLKNRPNRWVQGFLSFYLNPDRSFSSYQIEIVNGSFVWNNKVYV
jgi:hypothetical protein